jgi:hypothetical protein
MQLASNASTSNIYEAIRQLLSQMALVPVFLAVKNYEYSLVPGPVFVYERAWKHPHAAK